MIPKESEELIWLESLRLPTGMYLDCQNQNINAWHHTGTTQYASCSASLFPVRPAFKTWITSYPRCRRISPSMGRTTLSNSRAILAISPRSLVCDFLATSLGDPGRRLRYYRSNTRARRQLGQGSNGKTRQPTFQVRHLDEERSLRRSERGISFLLLPDCHRNIPLENDVGVINFLYQLCHKLISVKPVLASLTV